MDGSGLSSLASVNILTFAKGMTCINHRLQNCPVRRDTFSFRDVDIIFALWRRKGGKRVTGSATHIDATKAIIPALVKKALTRLSSANSTSVVDCTSVVAVFSCDSLFSFLYMTDCGDIIFFSRVITLFLNGVTNAVVC